LFSSSLGLDWRGEEERGYWWYLVVGEMAAAVIPIPGFLFLSLHLTAVLVSLLLYAIFISFLSVHDWDCERSQEGCCGLLETRGSREQGRALGVGTGKSQVFSSSSIILICLFGCPFRGRLFSPFLDTRPAFTYLDTERRGQ
jgi:hypothetical protein